MPKSRNSYNKGLNQDASRSKYDPASYYDALNIRVVTHDGLSTGSIENENGNQLTFELPTLQAENHTFPDGTTTTIPTQANLEIIGWCTLNEYIILFTTSATTPGVGQIWRIQYDEATNTIRNTTAPNFTLNPTDHLRYQGNLNFSAEYRIEAIGRYENGSTGRVYWTDFNNNLRTFNVLDDSLRQLNTTLPNIRTVKPSTLNIKPDVVFSLPKPVSVGLGSLPAGAKVQYAYRLTNSEGAQTMFSPASALVSLTEVDPNSVDYHLYEGLDSLSTTSRSVTFSIQSLDQDYELIEHIAVLYDDKDAPTVFKFGEEAIPLSGDLTVTLSGSETRIEISLVEYSAFSVGFEQCKTLTAKDNRLVVGNIKTSPAEIPDSLFDARTYRFRASDRTAYLDGESASGAVLAVVIDGTTFTIQSPAALAGNSWTGTNGVPTDHDAINPFNDESPSTNNDWATNDQYKFQADGTTLGGQGPFISYTFEQRALNAEELDSASIISRERAPFNKVSRTSPLSIDLGDRDSSNAFQAVSANGQFNNFASPIVESHLTGYSRGEIYRFGIEFITKRGTPTFVKWIGDIKFPEPEDGFPVGDGGLFTSGANAVSLNTLGITFTVTIPTALRDIISGYRIVRAERDDQNRTRLGTGTFFLFDSREENEEDESTLPFDGINDTLYSVPWEYLNSPEEARVGFKQVKINGDDYLSDGKKRFYLSDQPGIDYSYQNTHFRGTSPGGRTGYPSTRGVVSFMSPLTYLKDYTGFTHVPGDYVKTLGYYKARAMIYTDAELAGPHSAVTGVPDYYDSQGWLYLAREFENIDVSAPIPHNFNVNGHETFYIESLNKLIDGEVIFDGTAKQPVPHAGNHTVNASYGYSKYDPTGGGTVVTSYSTLGVGNDTFMMYLNENTTAGHLGASDMEWNVDAVNPARDGTSYTLLTSVVPRDNRRILDRIFRFKEVAYVRPLLKQYGGNTYEDRSKQQYISTNHYQALDDNNVVPSTLQFSVFGGDTYVNYFDKEFIHQYIFEPSQNSKGFLDPVEDDEKLSVAFLMPTESYINTDLVYGTHFNKNRNGRDYAAYTGDNYIHNRVYEQQNNAENKFFSKDFAVNFVEEFPHRLWASDQKLDGEQLDSWRSFLDTNYIDVEGSYGPINKVINFQDKEILETFSVS